MIGPVGGAQHDDALVAMETVHLGQQLVDRLIGVRMVAGRAPLAAHRVDFVDEEHARGAGLGVPWWWGEAG